ncbi:MAG: hypothetical protein JWR85_3102 [Marmoricola sp.]|nr:hypothetical protein [Marmoricola sp.]
MTPAEDTRPARDPGAVVVGDVLVDVLVSTDGAAVRHPGGAGLNLALAVRKLGPRASLVAPVARDDDGAWLVDAARRGAVDVIALEHTGPTGVATSRRVDGEPAYEFSSSVLDRRYHFDATITDEVARAGSVLAVNSFPMQAIDQAEALADLVTRTGQLFVVDPNARPALLDDVSGYRTGFRRLVQVADVVKVSEQDVTELGVRDPEAMVDELFLAGVRVVLLTRGARGASLRLASGDRVDIPVPSRPVPVIDTMGAGDATLAVLVAGIALSGVELSTERWSQLTVAAMELAADVCRVAGGSLPPRSPQPHTLGSPR